MQESLASMKSWIDGWRSLVLRASSKPSAARSFARFCFPRGRGEYFEVYRNGGSGSDEFPGETDRLRMARTRPFPPHLAV